MRMKSLILIFIALGCGLVASIGISQVMDRGGGSGDVEMDRILVALDNIDIGSRLTDKNVKLEDWPKNKVPEGAVRRLEDVKDKFAVSRFYKGEALHISKITDNADSVGDLVPQGYRAMPVKVEEDTVMKAISPGDKVDVMVFLRKSQEIPETGVFPILRNVRVFAVNTNTERNNGDPTDNKSQSTNFRTVTLLVKIDQTRDLGLAAAVGKILLTLRAPGEIDDPLGEEVTPIGDLLSGKSKIASDAPGSSNSGGSFLNTIRSVTSNGNGQNAAKTLIIYTPTGAEQYDWFNVNQLPVKSQAFSAGNTGSPEPSPGSSSSPSAEPTTDEPTPTTTPDPAKSWLD